MVPGSRQAMGIISPSWCHMQLEQGERTEGQVALLRGSKHRKPSLSSAGNAGHAGSSCGVRSISCFLGGACVEGRKDEEAGSVADWREGQASFHYFNYLVTGQPLWGGADVALLQQEESGDEASCGFGPPALPCRGMALKWGLAWRAGRVAWHTEVGRQCGEICHPVGMSPILPLGGAGHASVHSSAWGSAPPRVEPLLGLNHPSSPTFRTLVSLLWCLLMRKKSVSGKWQGAQRMCRLALRLLSAACLEPYQASLLS